MPDEHQGCADEGGVTDLSARPLHHKVWAALTFTLIGSCVQAGLFWRDGR